MNYQVLKQEIQVAESLEYARLTTYLLDITPKFAVQERPLVLVCPGGGYHFTSEREAEIVAMQFNAMGYHSAVLDYSCAPAQFPTALLELSKSVAYLRAHAKEWCIDPDKIAVLGFSAGGHLASVISTHADFDVRPDFSILFYPVISMDEKVSHKWSCRNFLGVEGQKDPALVKDFSTQNAVRRHLTPPALIIMASDDRLVPPVTNGVAYYSAMRNVGNECAMYIYPTGDHGFGFGTWFKYHDQMLTDIGNWLNARKTPKPGAVKVACIGNSITDGHGIDMATQFGYPALLQQKLGDGYWVKNFGVSARTMLNKGDFPYMNETAWKDALAFKPDVVIIKLGTNDSKPQNWKNGADFKQDLQQMIKALRPDLAQPVKKKGKKAKAVQPAKPQIYLCTPIPAFKSTWNINDSIIQNNIIPIQQEVAREYGLQVIDLHTLFADGQDMVQPDGIHPNEKGVKRMAEIIAEKLLAP